MEYTPRPWHREANTIVHRNKDGSLQSTIISMTQKEYRKLGQEAVGNMKLMAAAPAMYEALQIAKDYILLNTLNYTKFDAYKAITEAINLADKG